MVEFTSTQPQSDAEADFLELWEIGMKYYDADEIRWQYRMCLKAYKTVKFSELKDLKCWECPRFVCNGGNCDPI